MPAEQWNVALAAGIQSNFGAPNATILGLGGTLDETDGVILGDRQSGDGQSGITLPNFVREARERADVGLTKQADSFVRTSVSGLAIAFELKGNGITSTPSSGQAQPDPGIDALLQAAGLNGAAGTAPVYAYTAATGTKYLTVKLWVGDLSFNFQDCVVETFSIPNTGGEVVIAVANIRVGSIQGAPTDGVTFPTIDYGNQASLGAPTLVSAGFNYDQSRDFQSAAVEINNTIEEIAAANQPSGIRLSQDTRRITIDLLTEMDDANSDFDYNNLVATAAPTEDASWQLGSVTSSGNPLNGVLFELNNIQLNDVKYDRAGDRVAVQEQGECTATSAGGEFTLTFN